MIRRVPNRQSPLEQAIWALIALYAVTAFVVKPLVRWASPQLAVDAAAFSKEKIDPWGSSWGELGGTSGAYGVGGKPGAGTTVTKRRAYSFGPNLQDEFPQGDDLSTRRLSGLYSWLLWALWNPLSVIGPVLVSLLWVTQDGIRAKRVESMPTEFFRAAALALWPWIATMLIVIRLELWGLRLRSIGPRLVGRGTAVMLSAALLCFLLALWWRLTRPLESEESHG